MVLASVACLLLAFEAAPAQEKSPPAAAEQPAPPQTAEPLFKTLVKQFTLGGQIRLRAEYRDPTSHLNTTPDRTDDFILSRIRLNMNFSVTDDIDVFVQPQDQRAWGQEFNVLTDERNLDLHQGYVEVRNLFSEPITFKAGRMELSYGDQRLVSPLDWSNVARAWDGAKLRYGPKDWWIEGFYTVIRDPLPPGPNMFSPAPTVLNGAAQDQEFMGLYFSYVGIAEHEFDVYAFFRQLQDASAVAENLTAGDLEDRTLGARIKGKDFGFEYTLEAMTQGGHASVDRVVAYAYAATLAYGFDLCWKPSIAVEYAFASGDRHPTDGRRGTFDPLFPFFHYYQGYADVFGFKNSKDLSVYLKLAPLENVTVHVDVHAFWLAQAEDAWYNDPGAALRRDATGSSSTRIGTEVDVHTRFSVGKHVKFWAGWSLLVTGQFVRKTAAPLNTDDNMNWFFIQMTVDF